MTLNKEQILKITQNFEAKTCKKKRLTADARLATLPGSKRTPKAPQQSTDSLTDAWTGNPATSAATDNRQNNWQNYQVQQDTNSQQTSNRQTTGNPATPTGPKLLLNWWQPLRQQSTTDKQLSTSCQEQQTNRQQLPVGPEKGCLALGPLSVDLLSQGLPPRLASV